MPVEIRIVNSRKLLKDFIYLPSEIHSSYNRFVPPFYKDEFDFHDPGKNSHLQSCDTILLLAYKNNKISGRIMGIISHPWIAKTNQKWGRFFKLDCIDDHETAKALLEYIENWSAERGMTRLTGPFGFSDKDPQGIQVEGFEYPPVIASVSHQPYLGKLVAACGYEKLKDCVSYLLNIPETIPEVYKNTYNRILKNHQLQLLEFKNRKSLRPYFVPVMELMNEGYKNIFGFVPMSKEDIEHLADQYLSVLDPKLVKMVVNENWQPVAFVIAMANISKGIQKAKGRLFPFGFLHILLDMKRSKQLDLLLGAVAEAYRGRGLNVLMGIALMQEARLKGLTSMDSHLILEENKLMCAEMENIGGKLHKRYRIYSKELSTFSVTTQKS